MAASNNPPTPTPAPNPPTPNTHPVVSFIKKYPRTSGIIGNAAFGAAQSYVENKLGINDDFTDRYYQNSSGHPMLGEFAGDAGLGLINPAAGVGMVGTSVLGGGLKYINKKAGGIDLYGDGDLGQYGDLIEKPGRAIKFALDNTFGRLFHNGKLGGRGYTSDDDADVKFGDSAKLKEINENGGLVDYYDLIASQAPQLKNYFKRIDPNKYLGLTMDQLRTGNVASEMGTSILTGGGRYHTHDMLKFMDSYGIDPTILGIHGLANGSVGVDLSPEFYKEFVLSDFYKGDKNAELKRLGFDPQKVYAEQHAKEVAQQQQGNDNTTDPITSKYMADWAAKKQAIEQGKWIPGKSDIQNGQLVNGDDSPTVNGDDSPTIEKHEKNTVDETKQPNVHKDNTTDQYLQYLMYRDYQKDKQRAESKKDMGLIPLLLAAYGMAKIVR